MVSSGFSQSRWSVWRLFGATATGLAAFAATWLLLAPAAIELQSPIAVVRRPVAGDDQIERLAAGLLRSENLRLLASEIDLQAGDVWHTSGVAEWVRNNLRVEIGDIDRAGEQTVSIRWIGKPDVEGAARLVNALAHKFADQPSAADTLSLQRQLDQAHAETIVAERALTQARRQFDNALATASVSSQYNAPPTTPAPTQPPASESSDHSAWHRARQQLAELEQRRETLAERLMPEHPEMKALDEKIDVLRSGLNNQPTPAPVAADDMPEVATNAAVDSRLALSSPEFDRVKQLGQKVLAAQERYDAALSAERACLRQLAQATGHTLTEIEPAIETPQFAGHHFGWQRRLVSFIAALGFGGLALAIGPGRRQTFTSVEEVRASTRLPVVVVDRVMLN